jgi:hypothetical protein
VSKAVGGGREVSKGDARSPPMSGKIPFFRLKFGEILGGGGKISEGLIGPIFVIFAYLALQ